MIASVCQHDRRRTNGKTKAGTIRFRCLDCGKSFTASTETLDGMRIGLDRAAQIIHLLVEGMSIRSIARFMKTDEETILDLLVLVGGRCKRFMKETFVNVQVSEVQCDEIWGFIGMKEKTAKHKRANLKEVDESMGDAYCFTAIERHSKLLVAWHLGKRDDGHTALFVEKVQDACCGHFHLSTDGWASYPGAIIRNFGRTIEYGVVVKIFGKLTEWERRAYSPPQITAVQRESIIGSDAKDRACTSHMERCNGSIRLFVKRMNRLTYAYSKKWENHEAMLALFFAYYNFCWKNAGLKAKGEKPRTAAMAAKLADHIWDVSELLAATANS